MRDIGKVKGELSRKPRHLIQVVGRRTGISSDVIRAWERRYGAVISQRTETNRRLYTDDDIEKLTLLKRATSAGRRIGDIARLSYDDLFELVMGDESNTTRSYQRPSTGTVMELFDEAASAIDLMDSNRLDVNKLIFNGGEEYEIVATINPKNMIKMKKYARKNRIRLYEIGYVTRGKGVFHQKNGKLIRIKDEGWQHFQ